MTDRLGFLHVIAGPMFAGKTIALMAEAERCKARGETIQIVTHAIDDRHSVGSIAAHSGESMAAGAFTAVDDLVSAIDPATSAVLIDEAQFFGSSLIPGVMGLLEDGLRVVLSGLSVTFDGQPFEPIPALMSLADSVEKLVARCAVCGAGAPFHQPLASAHLTDPLSIGSQQIGGTDTYQARCRKHFTNHP